MNLIISEHRVLESAAGFYIGTLYFEEDGGYWAPYDRESGYYRTKEGAQKDLFSYVLADCKTEAEFEACTAYLNDLVMGWAVYASIQDALRFWDEYEAIQCDMGTAWPSHSVTSHDADLDEIYAEWEQSDEAKALRNPPRKPGRVDEPSILIEDIHGHCPF